jgi:hypothetical protein
VGLRSILHNAESHLRNFETHADLGDINLVKAQETLFVNWWLPNNEICQFLSTKQQISRKLEVICRNILGFKNNWPRVDLFTQKIEHENLITLSL